MLRAGIFYALDRTLYHADATVPGSSTDVVLARLVEAPVPEHLAELSQWTIRLLNLGPGTLTNLRARARWDGASVTDTPLFGNVLGDVTLAAGEKDWEREADVELGPVAPIDIVADCSTTDGVTAILRITFP